MNTDSASVPPMSPCIMLCLGVAQLKQCFSWVCRKQQNFSFHQILMDCQALLLLVLLGKIRYESTTFIHSFQFVLFICHNFIFFFFLLSPFHLVSLFLTTSYADRISCQLSTVSSVRGGQSRLRQDGHSLGQDNVRLHTHSNQCPLTAPALTTLTRLTAHSLATHTFWLIHSQCQFTSYLLMTLMGSQSFYRISKLTPFAVLNGWHKTSSSSWRIWGGIKHTLQETLQVILNCHTKEE